MIVYEITASTEDNLWHMIYPGAKFTLCGKEPRKDLFIEATPAQEVMGRLTGRGDIMECQDCKELAKTKMGPDSEIIDEDSSNK